MPVSQVLHSRMPYYGMPGGGIFAITATPIAVDLSALRGYKVLISCDDQNLRLSFAADASNTTLVNSNTAASTTTLVGKRVGKGVKVPRIVSNSYPYLIVSTDTGSGTLVIEPVEKL